MDMLKSIDKFTVITGFLITLMPVGVLLARQKPEESKMGTGERFHKETSFTWRDAFSAKPKRPPQYKAYPNVEKVELPKPHPRIGSPKRIRLMFGPDGRLLCRLEFCRLNHVWFGHLPFERSTKTDSCLRL